jgi:Baseplate J-like protein
MKQPCGCCAGIEIVTPEQESNRPGLSAIAYRAGTYATFLETMLARISNYYLDVTADDGSGTVQRTYPLRGLTTRALTDPSIAFCDAWATVADVLTFYQERIANEGFLRTATERLSVVELARLIGYRLRPAISASVYLAFTVTKGFDGIIPQGMRSQSIPGVGQKPQFFETYEDLAARDVWNDLGPRLTRPQIITLAASPLTDQPITIDQGTDAATRDTIYFDGISTNLKAGDALLIVSGDGPGEQYLRLIDSVNVQADQKRTEVILQEPQPQLTGSGTGVQRAISELQNALEPFIEDADNLFAGGDLAAEVAALLQALISDAQTFANDNPATSDDIAAMVAKIVPQIEEKHEVATRRGFSRLEPWISDLTNTLTLLVQQLPRRDEGPVTPPTLTGSVEVVPRSLGRLDSIVQRLALSPSLQPANTFRLTRQVTQVFAPESDIAPRLLATFQPRIAKTLYDAWAGTEPTPTPITVYAMRAKAAPFGNNAPLLVSIQHGTLQTPTEWPLDPQDQDGSTVYLESVNDKIVPNSWIVLNRTDSGANNQPLFTQVTGVKQVSRANYGMAAKTTALSINNDWLGGIGAKPLLSVMRGVTIYAQSEELALAEEPLDRDVEGNTIELDGLYDGLESGRSIIVSGQRTDIVDNSGATTSTGVTACERAMIAAVTQGPGKQSCLAATVNQVPFSGVYSVAGPNANGDLLVVGVPNPGLLQFLANFPLPTAVDQEICDSVQLAPGLYANVYVPTTDERGGVFNDFDGLLIDPGNGSPFTGGKIPTNRSNPDDPTPVFAWRIGSLASANDTLHTTLVLANELAYSYDASTVTIYGNVVKATHGQTQGEVLGNGDSRESLQEFPLHQSPLTYLPVPTTSGAESSLVVRVNEVEWEEADNLFVLGPTDREYITRTDDSGITTVITGNGDHGLRVPTGTANVKAVYRSGSGQTGNVDARQISQLATQQLGVQGVINPLAATGGADGDTRDQARRNIPVGTLALDRLVSVSDYADFARKFAGIGKASSARLSDGRKLVVYLTIAGKDDVAIDPTTDLYQALQQALLQAGDPHQPLQIALRRLKVLVISAGVKVLPAYPWETVAADLRAAVLALYSFDNRELGQSAFLSEAVSAMQATAGVQYVDMRIFDSVSESVTAVQLASLASTLGLNSLVDAELAHIDPAAADPASRILPAELVILTPDIPDTLILTEITT